MTCRAGFCAQLGRCVSPAAGVQRACRRSLQLDILLISPVLLAGLRQRARVTSGTSRLARFHSCRLAAPSDVSTEKPWQVTAQRKRSSDDVPSGAADHALHSYAPPSAPFESCPEPRTDWQSSALACHSSHAAFSPLLHAQKAPRPGASADAHGVEAWPGMHHSLDAHNSNCKRPSQSCVLHLPPAANRPSAHLLSPLQTSAIAAVCQEKPNAAGRIAANSNLHQLAAGGATARTKPRKSVQYTSPLHGTANQDNAEQLRAADVLVHALARSAANQPSLPAPMQQPACQLDHFTRCHSPPLLWPKSTRFKRKRQPKHATAVGAAAQKRKLWCASAAALTSHLTLEQHKRGVATGAPTSHDNSDKKQCEVTYENISKFFHMNKRRAAKALGVTRSKLTAVCNAHGIERWPCKSKNDGYNKAQQFETLLASSPVQRASKKAALAQPHFRACHPASLNQVASTFVDRDVHSAIGKCMSTLEQHVPDQQVAEWGLSSAGFGSRTSVTSLRTALRRFSPKVACDHSSDVTACVQTLMQVAEANVRAAAHLAVLHFASGAAMPFPKCQRRDTGALCNSHLLNSHNVLLSWPERQHCVADATLQ